MRFNSDQITIFDKLLSAASYLTMGMVGFIWLLVTWLIFRKPLSRFLSYHIYQSIFISIFLYIIGVLYSIVYSLAQAIPFIGKFALMFNTFFFDTPVYFTFSLGNFITILIVGYLALGAILGKYSYLPFVSDVINANFRN